MQISQSNEKKQWTNQTNLSEANKLKQQGNKLFKQKDYKSALKKYHQAILHLAGIIDKNSTMSMYTKTATEQVSYQANLLKYSIWLNMCQIYIFQQKYEKCLQTLKKSQDLLNKSLNSEENKKLLSKLYYRKGISYMKLNYLDEARRQFNKLRQLDSSFNKELDQFEQEIKVQQRKQNQKAKKIYKGLFS